MDKERVLGLRLGDDLTRFDKLHGLLVSLNVSAMAPEIPTTKLEASAHDEKTPEAPCFPLPTAYHQSEGSAPEEAVAEVAPEEMRRVWLGAQSST